MKGFIVYPTYKIENGSARVYLFGRLENGESFLTMNSFKPYFFIRKSDLEKASKITEPAFSNKSVPLKDFDEEHMEKIILDIPKDVPVLRKKFEDIGINCYEADIRFAQRFLMDKEILCSVEINGQHRKPKEEEGIFVDRIYEEPELNPADFFPELKVISIDIETDISGKKIYSVSIYCNDYKKVLIVSEKKLEQAICFDDEKSMLEAFKRTVIQLDPDIITGWSLVDFDLDFIMKKFNEHSIAFKLGRIDWKNRIKLSADFFRDSSADIPGRATLDGIFLLKASFIRLEDYKLATAAMEFLGEKKLIGESFKAETIDDYYASQQQKLVDYNLKDSELVYKILEKTGVVKLTILRSMLTGLPLERVRASIASFDSLYLRHLRKKGYAAMSLNFVEKEEQITGGFVMKSKPGIYDHVIVLDFKSLYPSIIRTFNIDPLSFVRDKSAVKNKTPERYIETPNGAIFRNEEGLLPSIIESLWKQRDAAKKRNDKLASNAIKILMNSFFGVLASPNCRFFSLEMSNAITQTGQFIIKLSAKKIEEDGYEVIYGDSITKERYVTLLTGDKVCIKNIEELFNENLDLVKKIGEKERINLKGKNVFALTLNKKTLKPEFSKISELVRHKTNKKIYRINQKHGETCCTGDHSLIIMKNNQLEQIKPCDLGNNPVARVTSLPDLKQIKKLDLYEEFKKYSYSSEYKGCIKTSCFKKDKNYVWFNWMNRKKQIKIKRFIATNTPEFESLCRLLGAYISEGSSSTKETTRRKGASISAGNINWLKEIKKDYFRLFSNAEASIIRSTKKKRILKYKTRKGLKRVAYFDNTYKLQMMNETSALFFKLFCGQTSKKKKLPEFIYHIPERYKKILIDNMILGDGSRETSKKYTSAYRKKHFRYHTSSLALISGLSLLLRQLAITYSIQYNLYKKSYRLISSDVNNANITTKITEERYSGYVYDLAVKDNNMFVDSCGQILLHNTDSIFLRLDVSSPEEAESVGNKIEKGTNNFMDKYISENYKRKSYLEIEFDKVYKKFLMPKTRGTEEGSKKRYAGLLFEDGKEKMDFTGLEFVRRDWTDLAKKFQLELLTRVFQKQEVVGYVKEFLKI